MNKQTITIGKKGLDTLLAGNSLELAGPLIELKIDANNTEDVVAWSREE